MPTPRKYATRALRQAAYRQRTRQSQDNVLLQRGLPPGPAIATMPGTARWNTAVKQARGLVEMVVQEMQGYHDDRSEQWQETAQASAFNERMDALQELIEQFDAAEI